MRNQKSSVMQRINSEISDLYNLGFDRYFLTFCQGWAQCVVIILAKIVTGNHKQDMIIPILLPNTFSTSHSHGI